MSTKNPFRTPIATPNPTGISQAPRIQTGSSPPLPSLPTPDVPPTPVASSSYRPSTAPPPGFRSTESSGIENVRGDSGNDGGPSSGGGQIASDDLNVEAPPAYTPAADMNIGESTLELGPRRPFQQPPVIHRPPHPIQQSWLPQQNQPYLSPQASGIGGGWQNTGLWSQSNPSLPQRGSSPRGSPGGWSAYPGRVERMNTGTSSNLPPPPPRHPQSQPSLPLTSSSSSLPTMLPPAPVSDFARDFYAVGAGDRSEELPRPSGTYAPPPGPPPPSSPSQYAPPPGSPPGTTRSPGTRGGTPSRNEMPDDGRPTTSPTPGHPLLLNGKLLVYPNGRECHKCNNTGFKSFDPSHPCRKCWDRYGKPYTGAFTYTPWSNDTSRPSNSNTTFQRPLPSFAAPQHPRSHSQIHNRTVSNPTISRAHTETQRRSPLDRTHTQIQTHAHAQAPLSNMPLQIHVASPYSLPPPGATIVQPGDHRIGGRICYKCGGSGVVPFFIFDETTCVACGGVGRIFG